MKIIQLEMPELFIREKLSVSQKNLLYTGKKILGEEFFGI